MTLARLVGLLGRSLSAKTLGSTESIVSLLSAVGVSDTFLSCSVVLDDPGSGTSRYLKVPSGVFREILLRPL